MQWQRGLEPIVTDTSRVSDANLAADRTIDLLLAVSHADKRVPLAA